MTTAGRWTLTVMWLTVCLLALALHWQADALGKRAEQRDCWAADQRITLAGLEYQVLITQGVITDDEATAALEDAAQELATVCPTYRSPLAGAP